MAVSLNKMKSAFRIGDGETMIALAAAVNGGALQADWREPEPIGSVGQARFLDGKKFNFKKQVDYAVWAKPVHDRLCSCLFDQQIENAPARKQSTAFTNFLPRPQKPAQAAKNPLS